MSRAAGKHGPRQVPAEVDPDSPEGRELGMSPRMQGYPSPIPGGQNHVVNAPTVRQRVPVKDSRPEITDLNAHGVPPGSATSRERAEMMRGPNSSHAFTAPLQAPGPATPMPVPVFVVPDPDPLSSWRSAAPHNFLLNAYGNEPTRICGRDSKRTHVLLLNESTSSNIRFGQRPADLNNAGGALLPWPTNSYTKIDTQDELFAISADSGTPRISVIQVFATEGTT